MRLIWFLAALNVKRGRIEALFNVVRLKPPTRWRTGVRVVTVEEEDADS